MGTTQGIVSPTNIKSYKKARRLGALLERAPGGKSPRQGETPNSKLSKLVPGKRGCKNIAKINLLLIPAKEQKKQGNRRQPYKPQREKREKETAHRGGRRNETSLRVPVKSGTSS